MDSILHQDPVGTLKWLGLFISLAGLYFMMRRWEAKLTGKIDEIKIQQPLEVIRGSKVITEETIMPIQQRVVTLENEVRVIRLKMEADKNELLAKIDELRTENQNGFRSLERAIGRLEGKQ
jgi:hypothetical protein